jgi:hypothetical protein
MGKITEESCEFKKNMAFVGDGWQLSLTDIMFSAPISLEIPSRGGL